MQEEELLTESKGGDLDALSELLTRYAPEMKSRFSGQIPKRWQALFSEEDVLQQTYCDAFLDIHTFQSDSLKAFVAWLCTLAKRNLVDAIRMLEAEKRGGGRQPIGGQSEDESLQDLAEALGATSSTPTRAVARDEAKLALRRAISRLPDDYRRVIELYDLAGDALSDVAAALGRRSGAVLMLRARAHRKLAEMMGSRSDFLSNSS